ncbi:MAG: endonuclease III domain-containing protein [Desulfovibrionaceae bacterium]|nr:endonuclease III domain-containing protein [Desulfovibrionaceae bacterium]
MLGAVLTQNTSWSNVEKAIANLKAEKLIDFSALNSMNEDELAQLIRPAGFFRLKARRIKALLNWLDRCCGGDIPKLEAFNTAELRGQLLNIKGVGPETADAILLYALNRPAFVVDEYTRRIFSRHGMVEPEIDYHELQAFFTDVLPEEASMFREYHAHLVTVAKGWCKRRKPDCTRCPLRTFLEQDFYE